MKSKLVLWRYGLHTLQVPEEVIDYFGIKYQDKPIEVQVDIPTTGGRMFCVYLPEAEEG